MPCRSEARALPAPDAEVRCGECRARMALRRGQHGLFWGCTAYPACRGLHGAHQATGAPLGTPADAETRAARVQAHQAFDRLWQSRAMSRAAAYRWLATVLALPQAEAHIGRLDVAQCARVVAAFQGFQADARRTRRTVTHLTTRTETRRRRARGDHDGE